MGGETRKSRIGPREIFNSSRRRISTQSFGRATVPTQGYALSSPTSIDLRMDILIYTITVWKVLIAGRNLCRRLVGDLTRTTRSSAPSVLLLQLFSQSIQQHGSELSC